MKFRTQHYADKQSPQSFDYTTKLYRLDEVKGVLVDAGVQDDFELIQSDSDVALDKVLERFGYNSENIDVILPQKWHENVVDGNFDGLDSNDFFPDQRKNLQAAILNNSDFINLLISNLQKGDLKNEKTHEQESEQAPVSQHGEANPSEEPKA